MMFFLNYLTIVLLISIPFLICPKGCRCPCHAPWRIQFARGRKAFDQFSIRIVDIYKSKSGSCFLFTRFVTYFGIHDKEVATYILNVEWRITRGQGGICKSLPGYLRPGSIINFNFRGEEISGID